MVGEGNVFIKDEAKVASRAGDVKRRTLYFVKLLFESNEYEFSL